jgi:peptidyl-prolyl cis-trans isomerase D
MLKFMRDQMSKTFLALLVAGISLVFVFFGIFPEMKWGVSASGSNVAAVGGENITAQQLQNAVQQETEKYRALGMDLPPELSQRIKLGTLQGLIQGKLMLVEARRLGIQVADSEVTEEIRQMPYFLDKNKSFSVDLYKSILAQNHISPGQFEEDVRESLVNQRMQKFLSDRIRVTPEEVKREYEVAHETRNIVFERFTREDAMKHMKVDEKELEAFMKDETRKAQISTYYAQNNLRYNQPEKVCARHILKRVSPTAAHDEKAPKEFLNLKPTAQNFAKLAEKYSEDPGSKAKGGDLDCFPRGAMDKAFEQAAFSLPVGKVSEPVRSQFGWHYILVTKKVAAVSHPLDKVRREIAEDLIKRERLDEIRKINMQLAEEAAKNWSSRKAKATATGDFSRLESAIPQIGRAPEIMDAAFDPKAKIQNGPQIFESQGSVIVASVKERKAPDMAKFEKEKDQQASSLKDRKFRAFMPAWLEDVKSRTKISYNSKLIEQI